MTRQEKLYDDYENALFALLMDDVAAAQGEAALAENQRLKADPAAVVPGDLHARCVRTVRRRLAAGRRHAAGKVAFRMVSRVAVVLMALMLTLTAAFAASPEVRTAVTRWAVRHYADHTEFAIPNSNTSDPTERDTIDENGVWVGSLLDLVVDSIPDGMQLVDSGKDSTGLWKIYMDTGRRIVITANYLGHNSVSIDTENASMSLVTISDRLALFSSSNVHCSFFVPLLELDGYLFIDFEGFADDEALSIAEKISLK